MTRELVLQTVKCEAGVETDQGRVVCNRAVASSASLVPTAAYNPISLISGLTMVALLASVLILVMTQWAHASEWYSGGNLHKAMGAQWRTASYQNRLATSADFVAGSKRASDMSELRERAIDLE